MSVVIVSTTADVDYLLARAAGRPFLSRVAVGLHVPQLDPAEQAAIEERLNQLIRDCGCSMGGGVALISAATALVWQLSRATPSFLLAAAAVAATTVVMAGVGKVAGLAFAAIRFRRTCKALRDRIAIPV